MGFDKALGILIIIACLMAVFFLIIRKDVMKDVVGDRNDTKDLPLSYISFLICYLIFTLVTWGFVMAIIFGIRLIVG